MSDQDEDTTAHIDVVLVKKPECLACTHLVGDLGTVEHDECYRSRSCPAASYRIALGVDLLSVSAELAQAWQENDLTKISNITERLSKVHPAVVEKVMTLAKGKLRGTT